MRTQRRSEFKDQLLSAMGNGTMPSTMSHFAKRDRSPLWREALRRTIDGMIDLAYYWPSVCFTAKDRPAGAQMPLAPFKAETSVVPHGQWIQGVVLGLGTHITVPRW